MPTFYNYTENGVVYSFDDVFVPADAFRQGDLWVWGNNFNNILGINSAGDRSTPVTTFAGGTNWKQSSGSAAIKTDGTLWVWGYNSNARLGVNDANSRSTPVTTFAGGTDWKQVSLGSDHIAAIKTDGTLWTWGRNLYGQLGINDFSGADRSTPVTTFAGGNNWKQVACGESITAAIKTDGTLWLWGRNSYGGSNRGSLGNNATSDRSTPVTTFAGGTNWKQVSVKNFITAAIKTDGTLWTWGYNVSGQLGINDIITRSTPVTTFAGGNNWKQVACGEGHMAAIKTDGTLWTWGSNGYGQLGINNTINRSTPVTTFVGGTDWKQVACARGPAVIKTDGTLWIWGGNIQGQLGINDKINRSTPVTTFAGGNTWKQVFAGSNLISALTYIDDYQ